MNTVYLKNPLVIATIGGITLSIIMYMKNKSSGNEEFSTSYYVKVFAVGAFASGGLSYGTTFLKNNAISKVGGDIKVPVINTVPEVSATLPKF